MALPELFNFRFIEFQYSSDPQLEAIYQTIKAKNPDTASKVQAINRYSAQFINAFHIPDNCLWMGDKCIT